MLNPYESNNADNTTESGGFSLSTVNAKSSARLGTWRKARRIVSVSEGRSAVQAGNAVTAMGGVKVISVGVAVISWPGFEDNAAHIADQVQGQSDAVYVL